MGEPKVKRSRVVADATTEELSFDVAPPAADPSPSRVESTKKMKKSSRRSEPTTAEVAAAAQAGSTTSGAAVDDTADVEVDVPAVSHKEARLAKRRKLSGIDPPALPLQQSSIHPSRVISLSGNTIQGAPGVTVGNTPGKSAHGVWIGNMNYSTTNKMVLGWLEERGLKEVVRMNMPNGKRNGENNRGFAYVDFPTAVDVEIAVGLSEQHLDGRKLLIKSSSDFTGRPSLLASASSLSGSNTTNANLPTDRSAPATLNKLAKRILDRQRNAAGPTLFVGNLGFETTVDSLREMFDVHQRAAGAWIAKKEGGSVGGDAEEKVDAETVAAGETEKIEVDEDREDDDDDEEEEEVAATAAVDEDEDESEESDEDEESEEEEEEDSDEDEEEPMVVDEDADLTLLPIFQAAPKRIRSKPRGHGQADDPSSAATTTTNVKEAKDLSKAKDAGIRKIRLGTFEDTGKCKGWAFVDFHLPEQCTRALLNVRNHTLDGRALNVEYASAEGVRRGAIGTTKAVVMYGAGRGGGGDRGGRGGRGGSSSATRGGGRGGGAARGKGREWDDGDAAEADGRPADRQKPSYDDDDDFQASEERAPRSQFGFRPSSAAASRGGRGGRGGQGGDRDGSSSFSARGSSRGGRGGAAASGGDRIKSGAALAGAQRGSEAIVESTGRKITFG